MRIRAVLLCSAAILAISCGTAPAAGPCSDDRYACEPKAAADIPAQAPAAAASSGPTTSLNLAGAPPVKPATKTPHATKHVAKHQDEGKASFAKAARPARPGWNILTGTPTLEQKPDVDVDVVDADDVTPLDRAASDVRVVSPEEFNEIDQAAPPARPEPQRSGANEMNAPSASAAGLAPQTEGVAAREVATEKEPEAPANTALLERVLVTFSGAFGAASAIRLFVG